MKKYYPQIIAEAGCNHMGEMSIAKDLIIIASVFCKADVIKFQKRTNKELLTTDQYNAPHPNPQNSYGKTYGEHREHLEFSIEQHKQLKKWCEEFGIIYSCSVWDLTAAKEIASIHPGLLKIPSASNNHFEMLTWLCENYKGEIHLSFGMTTHAEEEQIVDLFKKHKRLDDLVLYSCTSGYPVPPEDIALCEITRIKEKFGKEIKAVGFSGHHLGTKIDLVAYALGASVIERHFTMNQKWKGTDHQASLEPEDLKILKNDLDEIAKALTHKKDEILEIEQVQRDKLKYRVK